MWAAVYRENGGPEVLSYEQVPDPVLKAGEVLIKVEAISIEGADLLRRRGLPPEPSPRIEGYVAAGSILALGANVTGWSLGDRVVTFGDRGSHAALRAVNATNMRRVPDRLGLAEAAVALISFGTADLALSHLGSLRAGETVLVQGAAGGVGVAAVQIAHLVGAHVIGTGSTTTSLERLRSYGLDEPLPTGEGSVADRVRALTDGRGADLLIDTVGGAALQEGIDALKDGGRALMVGRIGGGSHRVDAFRIMTSRKALIGCMLGPVLAEPEIGAMVDALLTRVAAGELVSVIDATFSLSQAADAHKRAEQRGRIGRVVMVP